MLTLLQKPLFAVLVCLCLSPIFTVSAGDDRVGRSQTEDSRPAATKRQEISFTPAQAEPLALLLLGLAFFLVATTAKRRKSSPR